jgi:hypothetical protein
MSTNEDDENFEIFRDCLSVPAIAKLSVSNQTSAKKRSERRRKTSRKDASAELVQEETETDDLADLSEFIDVGSIRLSCFDARAERNSIWPTRYSRHCQMICDISLTQLYKTIEP